MSGWLDDKYINLLSFKLDRFKRLDSQKYNFRCPFCGDSQKSRFKARGNVFPSNNSDDLFYKCFNCGISLSVHEFIKRIDENLYKEYKLESLKERGNFKKQTFNTTISNDNKPAFQELSGLKKISQLSSGDPVKQYVIDRKIPSRYHYKLYYTKRFMEWINTILPDKFNEHQLKKDEPRLVIPFFDDLGNIFAVAGRSFKQNSIKYLTIKFNDKVDKIYGLNELDRSKKVYIVEGPIDSFFLDNSIAFAGIDGNFHKLLKGLDYVLILDNQPRNKEVVDNVAKLIREKEKVFIWPSELSSFKDINDMILGGYTSGQIQKIIDKNTYYDLAAQLKFNAWKKVETKYERYHSH